MKVRSSAFRRKFVISLSARYKLPPEGRTTNFHPGSELALEARFAASRIDGTSHIRTPSADESTAVMIALTIWSRVTSPNRRAVSRVAGRRSNNQYIGIRE